MLRKTVPFKDVKADADTLEFSGYASTFGNLDFHDDIIAQGAFLKTVEEWQKAQRRVKVLWQHDPWQPMGLPLEMREDAKGLFIRAKVSDTPSNRERMTLMRDGVVDQMSIGFEIVKQTREDRDGKSIRRIDEIKLWEFSPVTFPANEMATIDEVKNMLRNMRNTNLTGNDLKGLLEEIKSLIDKQEPLQTSTPAGDKPTEPAAEPQKHSDAKLEALIKGLINEFNK